MVNRVNRFLDFSLGPEFGGAAVQEMALVL